MEAQECYCLRGRRVGSYVSIQMGFVFTSSAFCQKVPWGANGMGCVGRKDRLWGQKLTRPGSQPPVLPSSATFHISPLKSLSLGYLILSSGGKRAKLVFIGLAKDLTYII